MLEALKETGQYDNTIIVFHSDHGEMLGDHGVYLKGPFFYDCCIRVPLIISWPGHIKPAKYPQLVELMDIPQTLLELCGYERYEGMQGASIVPLLEGKKEVLHKNAYSDYMNAMPWHRDPIAYASMVRTEDWKLVVSHAGNGEGELYDLKEDSAEQHNLFHLPAYRDIKLELYAQLLDRWAQQIDPFPVRKADW
jgi:arylsulfatase A-like enzyme